MCGPKLQIIRVVLDKKKKKNTFNHHSLISLLQHHFKGFLSLLDDEKQECIKIHLERERTTMKKYFSMRISMYIWIKHELVVRLYWKQTSRVLYCVLSFTLLFFLEENIFLPKYGFRTRIQ